MTTPDDPLQQGLALFQEQRYDEAIAVLSTITPSVPRRYAEALSLIGRSHSKLRQYDRAAEILEEAYERNPQPGTQYHWAEALIHLGRKAEAYAQLEEAVQRDDSLTDAFIHLGILKEERSLLAEAIHCYEKALVNDSKAVVARYRLAKIAFDKGDLKRAATQAYLVQQIAGNYPPVHKLMGSIALAMGDHRQAAVELCRVIELGEGDAEVYQHLGRAFANIGDLPQSLMAFEQAIKRNPNNPHLIQVAARMAQRLEDYPRAAAYYFILLDDEKLGEQAKAALAKLEAHLASMPPPPKPEAPAPKKGGLKAKPMGLKSKKSATPEPAGGRAAKHILPEIPENPKFNPPQILERNTEPLVPPTGSKFVADTGFAPGAAPAPVNIPSPKPRPQQPARPAPTAPLSAPPSAARPEAKKTAPLGLPTEKLAQVTDLGREKLNQVTEIGRERLNQVTDLGREKLQGMSREVMSKVMQGYKDAFSRFSKQGDGPAEASAPEPKFKLNTGQGGSSGTGKLPPRPGTAKLPAKPDPKKR